MLPKPQLNPASEVPLYHQLYRHFTELIQSGSLARGDRLPATRELAGLLGLNRTTISAAYELLESEGLISGQVGRGSFVTGAPGRDPHGLDWRALLTPGTSSPPLPQPAASKATISFAASRPAELMVPMDEFRKSCEEVVRGAE